MVFCVFLVAWKPPTSRRGEMRRLYPIYIALNLFILILPVTNFAGFDPVQFCHSGLRGSRTGSCTVQPRLGAGKIVV